MSADTYSERMTKRWNLADTTRLALVVGVLFSGLLFSISARATSAATPLPRAITPPSQAYLMSFHTCVTGATNCMSPANHIVQLAQSSDAVSWSLVPGWQSYRGSVPDVFRRGNTIYVYSTSGLLRIDATTGETSSSAVTISEGSFVDPSIAQLSDGRLILFFLPGIGGQDPAACAPGESSCVRQIRSAVEVAGSDGTQFTVDAGARVTETITSGSFSDPDIFFNGSEWVLYVSRGPSVHAYTSSTLQGSFVYQGIVSNLIGGVPSGLRLPDGSVATYVHSNVGASTEIRRATTATGTTRITAFQTVLTAQSLGLGSHAESPGIAVNTAGLSCATCAAGATSTTVPTTSPNTTAAPTSGVSPTSARSGSACSKLGATAKSGKIILVCRKVGKKTIWVKR
jgi:hypothetical protein